MNFLLMSYLSERLILLVELSKASRASLRHSANVKGMNGGLRVLKSILFILEEII